MRHIPAHKFRKEAAKSAPRMNVCLSSRYLHFQPSVGTPRPFTACILTTFLGGSKALSLAPAEQEQRSPSLHA